MNWFLGEIEWGKLEENVLIGIKLDYKNEYFYIATMHEISELKLNQRIKNGRLKSLTTSQWKL